MFFPVTSQTLENCSEEVRSVVAKLMNGAANTEPTTTTTTPMPLVPATPSTSGAQAFFNPVTMSAPAGPLPGKTLLHNIIWCLVFSTKTWWLACSFVASFLELPAFAKQMIKDVVDKMWSDGAGLVPLILSPTHHSTASQHENKLELTSKVIQVTDPVIMCASVLLFL